MNFGSTNPLPGSARRRAFTMLEMLLAVAILSVFISGIYTTYVAVARAHSMAEARMEALRNGRSALASLSDELKTLNDIGGQGLLISPNAVSKTFGDSIDKDRDGAVDEEVVDGRDDDATTATLPGSGDRHAVLDLSTGLYERPLNVGENDLGDANVDEDVRFGQDFVVFQTVPDAPSDILLKTVTYALPAAGFDGVPNVLVRQTRIERRDPLNPTGPPLVSGGIAPLAFDVLGFDLLFWDSNASPEDQAWLTSWDSTSLGAAKFRLPATVYARITLRADRRPLEAAGDGADVETLILATAVNIESVIGSPLFERPILP